MSTKDTTLPVKSENDNGGISIQDVMNNLVGAGVYSLQEAFERKWNLGDSEYVNKVISDLYDILKKSNDLSAFKDVFDKAKSEDFFSTDSFLEFINGIGIVLTEKLLNGEIKDYDTLINIMRKMPDGDNIVDGLTRNREIFEKNMQEHISAKKISDLILKWDVEYLIPKFLEELGYTIESISYNKYYYTDLGGKTYKLSIPENLGRIELREFFKGIANVLDTTYDDIIDSFRDFLNLKIKQIELVSLLSYKKRKDYLEYLYNDIYLNPKTYTKLKENGGLEVQVFSETKTIFPERDFFQTVQATIEQYKDSPEKLKFCNEISILIGGEALCNEKNISSIHSFSDILDLYMGKDYCKRYHTDDSLPDSYGYEWNWSRALRKTLVLLKVSPDLAKMYMNYKGKTTINPERVADYSKKYNYQLFIDAGFSSHLYWNTNHDIASLIDKTTMDIVFELYNIYPEAIIAILKNSKFNPSTFLRELHESLKELFYTHTDFNTKVLGNEGIFTDEMDRLGERYLSDGIDESGKKYRKGDPIYSSGVVDKKIIDRLLHIYHEDKKKGIEIAGYKNLKEFLEHNSDEQILSNKSIGSGMSIPKKENNRIMRTGYLDDFFEVNSFYRKMTKEERTGLQIKLRARRQEIQRRRDEMQRPS